MLDILRPAVGKVKPRPAAPQPPAQVASPTLSPASSTSTLKASHHSRPSHARTTSKSSIGAARSKGQQARRQSIESGVSTSHRYRTAFSDRHKDLLDSNTASFSSSLSSPSLAPFRPSTLASSPRPAQRSRGRSKYTRSNEVAAPYSTSTASSSLDPYRDEHSQARKRTHSQKPLLGGLYFSDLIVVAFFYAVNLLRTCGIAELVDVAFKAFAYVCTRLPFDFYLRWSLSRPSSSHYNSWYAPLGVSSSATERSDSNSTARPDDFTTKAKAAAAARSSHTSSTAVSAIVSSSDDDETTSQEGFEDDAQLSPFHHLTLLLVRFACTSFPHLVPRVLFAEETIGPLVRWRTGGGAAGIVREFTGEQSSPESAPARPVLLQPPARHDARKATIGTASPPDKHRFKPTSTQTNYTRPGFRAFWIGADAHVPVEVRRSDPSSKSASTLLYLHGGGFSLGSVAFYAEALIRIITKVCAMEDRDNDARCVAVEYDLGPTSRFPGPLLQCLRCYAHLIEVEGIDPAAITIAGDSAGGNLAMAMLLCLDGQARGDVALSERDWSALPMPGKAVLISPWADLRPSASLAFAHLREAAAAGRAVAKQPDVQSRAKSNTLPDDTKASASTPVSAWTEAMGQHEWDYVAAEALMHFAQLYAGVLKTPRRVRGPMGWVAHMCAVLAGDEEESNPVQSKSANPKTASIATTAPLNILRTLLPQRVARVAHSMLTEPLLNRAGTTKSTFTSKTRPPSDALNRIEQVRPSVVGALDPIFPPSERKTDAVPCSADLYIPIWQDSHEDVSQEKAFRDASDPDFDAAKNLLESSKLINPATGDWSRIKLKRGMLVTWGDRERLADDIEVWIDHVRHSQSTRSARGAAEPSSDDKPGQDLDPSQRAARTDTSGASLQERRAASRSPHRLAQDLPDEGTDWLCTAVEHGPGGVHAWPFVSMYLAGAEEEREKGLEIIARFIAEPAPSPASTVPPTPSSPIVPLAVQLPATHDQRYAHAAANSPPHLNAVSPAGSMPSDISSRGDADDNDYPFLGSSYTDSEGWDPSERNELGLEGVYPHETIWTEPTPTPSTGAGTPLDSDVESESIGHDELVHRVGLGLGAGSDVGSRNAEVMEPVHLHRPAHPAASSWTQPAAPQQRPTPRAPTQTQGRSSSTSKSKSSSSQTLGGPPSGRTLAELEAESDMSAPPSRPESPGWREDEAGYDSRTDDGDDLSAPSPQEIDRDAYFGGPVSYADDAIPMDPGFYGLAHYHTLRPEGLSDIAEEESQFDTSSVLSSGNGGGALSPGYSDPTFSPQDDRSPNVSATRPAATNPGRYGGSYAPSAAEMARLREALDERERQYQERFSRGPRRRFPIEEDDSVGDDDGVSDGDIDWLDMDDEQQQQQHPNAWTSSAEVPNQAGSQEQQGRSQRSITGRQGRNATASSTPRLSVTVDATAARSDLQPPPSPARSTSSQNSARDKWW